MPDSITNFSELTPGCLAMKLLSAIFVLEQVRIEVYQDARSLASLDTSVIEGQHLIQLILSLESSGVCS